MVWEEQSGIRSRSHTFLQTKFYIK